MGMPGAAAQTDLAAAAISGGLKKNDSRKQMKRQKNKKNALV